MVFISSFSGQPTGQAPHEALPCAGSVEVLTRLCIEALIFDEKLWWAPGDVEYADTRTWKVPEAAGCVTSTRGRHEVSVGARVMKWHISRAGPYRLAERPFPGSRMSHAGHPPPPPKPPDGWQKSLNEAAATTADVTKTSIIALRDSTDAFPPVKSLAGGVLAVWETAERASSKQRAKDLDERCCSFLMIADAVKDPNDVLPEMNDKLENFKIRLEDIRSTLNPLRKQKWLKSLAHLNRDQDELDDVKRRLDEAYDNVMISRMLMIHRDVAKTPIKLGHIDKAQDCIIARLSEIRNEVSSSNREPAEICRELATKLEAIDRDRGLTHLTYLFTISVVLF